VAVPVEFDLEISKCSITGTDLNSSIALGEICGDGRRGSDDLIGDGFERCGYPHHDAECDARGFCGFPVDVETG